VNTRSARSKSAVTATVHQPEGCIVGHSVVIQFDGLSASLPCDGDLQDDGLGVLRSGANAVAGCWPVGSRMGSPFPVIIITLKLKRYSVA
jgi:hypothetical protein